MAWHGTGAAAARTGRVCAQATPPARPRATRLQVVVKGMKALHSGVDGLEYMQADARSMPEVPVASFDAVIDKGTLDANMCGEAHEGITASQSIMLECYRVLKPGGRFIEITYGAPVDRLPVLGDRWRELEVFVLPKALPQGHAATAVDTRDCAAAIRGPFAAKDEDMMASLSGLEGVHFAFVAKK